MTFCFFLSMARPQTSLNAQSANSTARRYKAWTVRWTSLIRLVPPYLFSPPLLPIESIAAITSALLLPNLLRFSGSFSRNSLETPPLERSVLNWVKARSLSTSPSTYPFWRYTGSLSRCSSKPFLTSASPTSPLRPGSPDGSLVGKKLSKLKPPRLSTYNSPPPQVAADFSFTTLLASREEEIRRAEALDERAGLWDAAFVEGQAAFNHKASASEYNASDSEFDASDCDYTTISPASSRRSSLSELTPNLPPTPALNSSSLDAAARGRLLAKQKKNKKRANARWRKAQKLIESGKPAEAAYGRNSKRRRVFKRVHQTAIEIEAPSLPHSKQGYLGASSRSVPSTKSKASGTEDPRDAKLRECIDDLGYQLVEAKDCPESIVDRESTIAAWKPGVIGSREGWTHTLNGVSRAVVDLNQAIFGKNPTADAKAPKAGVARGSLKCAHYGYSFGGGQEVSTFSSHDCFFFLTCVP